LVRFLALESARDKKRPAHFRPPRFRETAKGCSDMVTSGKGEMIKIEGADNRHSIIRRQDNFC
jgi:hypothetical protein